MSLPYPEPGVRLIRHDVVESFAAQMTDFRAELDDAVANLDRHYAELKQAARERLGSLFNPSDYPESLVGLFGVEWDFPNVEPPDYLRPALAGALRGRAGARRGAVRRGRAARRAGVPRGVRPARRPPDASGSRASARTASPGSSATRPSATSPSSSTGSGRSNVRSNDQLDALVAEAQRAVRGVDARDLREGGGLRQDVAAQLARVRTSLDAMLVERPRRRILRQHGGAGGAP